MLCPFCVALAGCPFCFQVYAGLPGESPLQPVVLVGQQGAETPTLPSRSPQSSPGSETPSDDIHEKTDSET
jgi:hypothetical protein